MSRARKIAIGSLGILLVALLAGVLYLRSQRFHNYVLNRIVFQIEEATGGTVELEDYRFDIRTLEAELKGLIIRGRETDPKQPFVAAESVFVRLKIISLFEREIDWQLLRVTRPRLSVSINENGRSNIPEPKVKRTEGKGPLDKVWDLAIKRLEVIDGELSWNDERYPLEFAADDVGAELAYDAGRDLYEGRLDFRSFLPSRAPVTAAAQQVRAGLPAQVNAELRLTRTTLDIPKLTLATDRSRLEGSGKLVDFLQPKIEVNFKSALDAQELARAADYRPLRGGQAQLNATVTYDTGSNVFRSQGDLRLLAVSLALPQMNLQGVQGTAKFTATKDALNVSQFRLAVLGGTLAGSGRASDLTGTPDVRLNARAEGFSVAPLMRALATRRLPLAELRWAGAINGDVNAQFTVSRGNVRGLTVQTAVNITPPSVTPPGYVPVSGHANLTYEPGADRLDIRDLLLQTPGTRLAASGALGTSRAGQADLRLTATSTNLGEFDPLISAMRPGREEIPLELKGRTEFAGTMRGTLRSPSFEGRLDAVNFAYDGTQWDRFTGDLAYSRELLRIRNAELRRAGSFARVNLTAQLQRGEFTETTPFALDARIEGARVLDLQALAGTDYPITGAVDASVKVSGTQRDPKGGGFVSLQNGTIAGEPFDSLRANLTFANNQVRAQDIALSKGKSQITGTAQYRTTDKSFEFALADRDVPLGDINQLRSPRVRLSGLADFRAKGSGTVERPSISATLELTDLIVNSERIGALSAVVETRERQLTANVRSKFLRGSITGDVTATMTGDFPAKGRIQFTGVDLDPLLQEQLRGRITTHSAATGVIDIAGPLKKPEALAVNAELSDFSISLQQVDLRNQGPVHAAYRNGVVQIEQAHLVGDQTDLQVSGSVRLTGPAAAQTINVRADGSLNMTLLRTIDADVISSGQVLVNATATGTLRKPLLGGRAEFRRAAIAFVNFPTGLSEMNGTVAFDANRLRVEKMTAEVGGGKMEMTGGLDYGGPTPVFRLHADANGVRLRYPEGTSSMLNGSIDLSGTGENSQLSGEVMVSRVRFEPRFDLARTLGLSRSPVTSPVSSPFLNNMHLDVRVTSSPTLMFETSQARNVQLEANLRLRGTAARPAVLGRINLLSGEVTFAGTSYTLNRGDISFTSPVRIEPALNLDLSTRVQQYEIGISLNGKLDQLNLSYRSDPPLPPADIQALLVTGRAREGVASTQAPQTFTQIGANTLLSQALNATVSSRIERIFGVSRLKIDPQVGGPETNPGARVTLEQQVTPEVRFTYITNLSSTQQEIIQVEWSIDRRWSLIAVRDQNGLFGIDLKWRRRFR